MADVYKTLDDLVDMVNALTQDENDSSDYLQYVNTVIGDINMQLGTIFPEFTENNFETEYKAIPLPWTQLLVFGMCYNEKIAGDEEELAQTFLKKYMTIFSQFSVGYVVPKEYQGSNYGKAGLTTNDWTNLWNKKKVNLNMEPFKIPFIGFITDGE